MLVRRGFVKIPRHPRVVTLGVFDGVHRGHERILKTVRARADRLGATATVITFSDHPHGTLSPGQRPPRLATPEQCLQRFNDLGMDEVFLISFTANFAAISAERFIRHWLVKRLGLRHIVVGADFVFGKGGQGNLSLLRNLQKPLGFGVTVVPPLRDHGHVISSSRLRLLVSQGEVRLAARWLGWPYTVHGRVVHGDGRGTRIGLPTANLSTRHEIIPKPGTYAVLARIGRLSNPALCHIGRRPTFHSWGPETIEIYIPGWKRRIYQEQMAVEFLSRLREERRFIHAGALRVQVQRDLRLAGRVWQKAKKVK